MYTIGVIGKVEDIMNDKEFLEILKEVLEKKLDYRLLEKRQAIYDSVKHKIEKRQGKVEDIYGKDYLL